MSHLGRATSWRRWGLRRASRTCAAMPTVLLARARGELSAADFTRVANHVSRCPRCRALAETIDTPEADTPEPVVAAAAPGVWAAGAPPSIRRDENADVDPSAWRASRGNEALVAEAAVGLAVGAPETASHSLDAWVPKVPTSTKALSGASWVTAETSAVELPGADALPSRDAAEWRSATSEALPASPQDLPRARRRQLRLGRTVMIAMLAVLVAAAAAALAVTGVFGGSGKHAATHSAGAVPTSSSTAGGAARARRATPRQRRPRGNAAHRSRPVRHRPVAGAGARPKPTSLSIPASIAPSSPTPSTNPRSSVSPPPAARSAPSHLSTPTPPAGAVGVPTSPQVGRNVPAAAGP